MIFNSLYAWVDETRWIQMPTTTKNQVNDNDYGDAVLWTQNVENSSNFKMEMSAFMVQLQRLPIDPVIRNFLCRSCHIGNMSTISKWYVAILHHARVICRCHWRISVKWMEINFATLGVPTACGVRAVLTPFSSNRVIVHEHQRKRNLRSNCEIKMIFKRKLQIAFPFRSFCAGKP